MSLNVIKRTSARELKLCKELSNTISTKDIPADLMPVGAQILVLDIEETNFFNRKDEPMVNVYLATNAGNIFASQQSVVKQASIGGYSDERPTSNLDWLDREVVLWSKDFCDNNGITKGCLLENVKIVVQETTETPQASAPEYQKKPLREPRRLADGTFSEKKEIAYSEHNEPIYKYVHVIPAELKGPEYTSTFIKRAKPRSTSMDSLLGS